MLLVALGSFGCVWRLALLAKKYERCYSKSRFITSNCNCTLLATPVNMNPSESVIHCSSDTPAGGSAPQFSGGFLDRAIRSARQVILGPQQGSSIQSHLSAGSRAYLPPVRSLSLEHGRSLTPVPYSYHQQIGMVSVRPFDSDPRPAILTFREGPVQVSASSSTYSQQRAYDLSRAAMDRARQLNLKGASEIPIFPEHRTKIQDIPAGFSVPGHSKSAGTLFLPSTFRCHYIIGSSINMSTPRLCNGIEDPFCTFTQAPYALRKRFGQMCQL